MSYWVLDDDDELDVLRYDLEQAERKLRSMETAGQRVVNEPEWNQAVRRQRRKVEDLRGELAEWEQDDPFPSKEEARESSSHDSPADHAGSPSSKRQ